MGETTVSGLDKPGCCASGSVSPSVEIDLSCPDQSDDEAQIIIERSQPVGDDCVDYTVSYHY